MGVMKSVEGFLEENKYAGRKKRDQIWLMFVDLRYEFDEIEHNHFHGGPEWVLNPRYECEILQGYRVGSMPRRCAFASGLAISFFRASNSSRKPHFPINHLIRASRSILLNKLVSESERT